MSDFDNIQKRVTILEEWKNSQSVNSALIKQHSEHMDKRISDHAEHMDKRFAEHAEHMNKQITAMGENFKKINGWMSKLALAVMIAVSVGIVEWIMRGGLM